MSHNPYMRPTKFDLLTSFACVGFFSLAVGLGLNPIGRLEAHRDDEREHGVRAIYAAMVQMEEAQPEEYSALLERVASGNKVLLGDGADCSGYWGRQCLDAQTDDQCLNAATLIDPEFLPAVPISPGDDFSQAATGYYLQMHEGQISVGACNPSEGTIVLPAN